MKYRKYKAARRRRQAEGVAVIIAVILISVCATEGFCIASETGDPDDTEFAEPDDISDIRKPAETGQTVTEPLPEAEPEPQEEEIPAVSEEKPWHFEEDDAQVLLKLAMAEAEGESIRGKALVMRVVLNRVESSEFPDTIQEVVFQDGQFSPTVQGGRYYTTEPNEDCYAALELIENGWDESEGALYFESISNTGTWHKTYLIYLYQCGSHLFYRD